MLTLERETAPTPASRPQPMQASWRLALTPSATQTEALTPGDVTQPAPAVMAAPTALGIDPQVLRWMPLAVPMAAVLLCASIALIWTQL